MSTTWLGLEETEVVLSNMGDLASRIVLVGGQAVNFWAERYLAKGDEFLRARAPYTSKDIDFCGTRNDVRLCADRIGGRALLPDDEHPDGTNAGKVLFEDSSGEAREIDFITQPFGLDLRDTTNTAIPVTARNGRVSFLVMHAQRCMESRVHNFIGLPAYCNDHAAKQAAVSIFCAKRLAEEILASRAVDVRAERSVLKLNERIFQFCHRPHALELYRQVKLRIGPAATFDVDELDPFQAVLCVNSLPAFQARRFPQMNERLRYARERYVRARPSDAP